MRWWKKLIFSIVSLVWGYISLDFLYYAFLKLTDAKGAAQNYTPKGEGLYQLLGAGMFLLWFFINGLYFWLIQKTSPQIDMVEENYKTGEKKIRRKWVDIILQIAFIITGLLLRWTYIMYIYIPNA